MRNETLLIVDDEQAQLNTLAGYLRKQGYKCSVAANGTEAVDIVRTSAVDLVITDMRMPDMDGLGVLRNIRSLNPEITVIVMTAFGSVEDAVTAMKEGAEDYLQKPLNLDEVDLIIGKTLEKKRIIQENLLLKEALKQRYQFKNLISGSGEMEEVLNLAGRASTSRANVLIRGESGTGKEVIARAIHLAGPRSDHPFVAINVAAVPENLVESEFFGHEKGAFTGADRQRMGRFETADQGTLFIDEIGNIPISVQVKLLRVLQEQSFERVGGNNTVKVNVRVIAATNQDLEMMLKAGTFREDLFYRLNVISIPIPPLRQRRSEIPLFIDHFIRKYRHDEHKSVEGVSQEAMDILMKYFYPGNVRELENLIHRGVVLTRSRYLQPEDFPPYIRDRKKEKRQAITASLPEQVEALERTLIHEALEKANGNQSEAARRLVITERNLRYKIQKYQLRDSTK